MDLEPRRGKGPGKEVRAGLELCRRLDGIPLALELAAARLRALPVEEIAVRVNDRFRLLASGDRTALPRQKTLRALIDWSHDLLPEPERTLFRRLAVFAGGFTLDAAEAVAAGGAIEAGDVLELLTGLVDKSLVTLDAEASRYAMLETVRQYAMEKLDASGDGDPVRDKHLDHYLAMVEKAAAGFAGPERAKWLDQLDRARENILAAHAWSLRVPDGGERSYRLVFSTRYYWFQRGLLELGHRVSLDTIVNCPSSSATIARSRALGVVGQICAHMRRYREAQAHLGALAAALRGQRDDTDDGDDGRGRPAHAHLAERGVLPRAQDAAKGRHAARRMPEEFHGWRRPTHQLLQQLYLMAWFEKYRTTESKQAIPTAQ